MVDWLEEMTTLKSSGEGCAGEQMKFVWEKSRREEERSLAGVPIERGEWVEGLVENCLTTIL
jgi:hypothetical protein